MPSTPGGVSKPGWLGEPPLPWLEACATDMLVQYIVVMPSLSHIVIYTEIT
jgi:hypothetical protein